MMSKRKVVTTMNGKKRDQKYENCQTGDGKQIYTQKKKGEDGNEEKQ